MIDIELIRKYGAVEKKVKKGGFVFREKDKAIFFYQIISGVIKMNNYNEEGIETIQGIFEANDSFGEPPIFGEFPYPANAVALENTHLICLEKYKFLDLLKENADIGIYLLHMLSQRLRFKAMLSNEVKGYNAEHRILTLFKYLKKNAGIESDYCIEMTRQTIANLTGLRVETAIRTISKLHQEKKLKIKNRKIYI